MQNPTVLITGVAGFIGFHVAKDFLQQGYCVVGIDHLQGGDLRLKNDRLKNLLGQTGFSFLHLDLANVTQCHNLSQIETNTPVLHFAAQAGVLQSIDDPGSYVQNNLLVFANILEICRYIKSSHLIFASSSSVYGNNSNISHIETDNADKPISFYAATKRSNELMAHSYASLYKIPITALRFFTVYGPWGRPDMALYLFTKAIVENNMIQIFGECQRDFIYIDDVVQGVIKAYQNPPNTKKSCVPFEVYNIGTGKAVKILHLVHILESLIKNRAQKRFFPGRTGDMVSTKADIRKSRQCLGFSPKVSFKEGLRAYLDWFFSYYVEKN